MRHDDSPRRSLLQRGGESVTAWLVFGEIAQSMTDVSNIPLNGVDAPNAPFDAARDVNDMRPNDVGALQALLDAARADHAAVVAERDQLAARNEKLEAILAEIRRAQFGASQSASTTISWRWHASGTAMLAVDN